MERITKFYPAYDKRDPDPAKNYGVHGVDLVMALKGELGAVQFKLMTNWYPKETQQDNIRYALKESSLDPVRAVELFMCPMPADIGYHSPKPMYEDQHPMGSRKFSTVKMVNEQGELVDDFRTEETDTFTPCELLDGKPCYYDGSSLQAEKVYEVLLAKGSDGVWEYLENYYKDTFGELR